MAESEKEKPKESSDDVTEDLERIAKVVEEEIVFPEEEIEEEMDLVKPPQVKEEISLYDILGSINILKTDIRRLGERLDNLEQTINYLIDSLNEIKSIILMISHTGRSETKITPKEKPGRETIDKILDEAEDILFSTYDNELLRAIRIEAMIFDLEDILKNIREKKLSLPPEKIERLNEIYNNLKKESLHFQKKLIG